MTVGQKVVAIFNIVLGLVCIVALVLVFNQLEQLSVQYTALVATTTATTTTCPTSPAVSSPPAIAPEDPMPVPQDPMPVPPDPTPAKSALTQVVLDRLTTLESHLATFVETTNNLQARYDSLRLATDQSALNPYDQGEFERVQTNLQTVRDRTTNLRETFDGLAVTGSISLRSFDDIKSPALLGQTVVDATARAVSTGVQGWSFQLSEAADLAAIGIHQQHWTADQDSRTCTLYTQNIHPDNVVRKVDLRKDDNKLDDTYYGISLTNCILEKDVLYILTFETTQNEAYSQSRSSFDSIFNTIASLSGEANVAPVGQLFIRKSLDSQLRSDVDRHSLLAVIKGTPYQLAGPGHSAGGQQPRSVDKDLYTDPYGLIVSWSTSGFSIRFTEDTYVGCTGIFITSTLSTDVVTSLTQKLTLTKSESYLTLADLGSLDAGSIRILFCVDGASNEETRPSPSPLYEIVGQLTTDTVYWTLRRNYW
jgi:hypothetical protein